MAQIQNMRSSSRPRLLARARSGDVAAQTELGRNFFFARPMRKRQAAFWWRKAAHEGHAEAQYYLGLSYNGVVLGRDRKRSRMWLERAAAQGWSDAELMLGYYCAWGYGGPKDERRAHRHYLRAAAAGETQAMDNLGVAYRDGRGVRKNARRAFEWFCKASEAGNVHAALPAVDLAEEHGFELDQREASQWLHAAARSGHARSQLRFGVRLFYGVGVRQDRREALRWYRRAASQGESAASLNMGLMFKHGYGVVPSRSRARSCLEKAARLGNAWAALELADSDEREGRRRFALRKALQRLERGLDLLNPEAVCLLGIHYHNGSGVKADHAKAARLYRMAAERGEGQAMYLLGLCYRDGEGVALNRQRARDWLTKAAKLRTEPETSAKARSALAELRREKKRQ